ncbi:SEFIR domain-containing protein [Actinacidiphila sp. bgisy145]|uniref:SEFIR domain-containing protein n=1 Tax=Actinacidiphila sp. bgisy145 TaxID=3413792 RepID=UPI003EBEF213
MAAVDPLPEVALLLADGGGRWLDATPGDFALGSIALRGWQVHPVRPVPPGFAGQQACLVKINYDLRLEPDAPGPSWFEVGLALSCRESGTVSVADAVPRTVLDPQPPASYRVDGFLNLATAAGGDGAVHLPAVHPLVDVFGVGGPEVRWRHSARRGEQIRPGSYTHWLVLLAPADCPEVAVEVSARFDLPPDDALGHLPATEGAAFALRLAEDRPAVAAAPAPDGAPTAPAPGTPHAPRVFVSYAHDDEPHVEAVRVFSEFLARDCGFDVHMDRWDLDRRRDWYLWAMHQITAADFVLVIASPMCRTVGDGRMADKSHRGLQSEMGILRELLHSDRAVWSAKLLPVVLSGRTPAEIPLFLQPQSADHYVVADLSPAGAEDLVRAITGRPPYFRPQAAARTPAPGSPRRLP